MPRRGVVVSEIDVRRQLELLLVRRELERLMARLAARAGRRASGAAARAVAATPARWTKRRRVG